MNALAASILAVAVSLLLPVAHAAEHCSAASIEGHYGYTFSGFNQDDNGNNLPSVGTGICLMGPKEPFEPGAFCLLDCASARPLIANVPAAKIVTTMAIAMDELRT